MQLKRIDVTSAARTLGAVNAGLGTFMGLFLALSGLTGAGGAPPDGASGLFAVLRPAVVALVTLVLVPILYGLLGLLAGAFSAWLYNVSARHLGGLEVEVE